ncbi:MAG: nucleotidyltransferase family protein [Chlorobi bacterium]|nr:nucleotidyltransferase family protein [Chlorobiota bacterium]
MDKDQALALLRDHKAVMDQRFGVADIALFGSIARGEATPDSDMDILVRFEGPATSKRYFGVQFYLEDLTGLHVDLVTDKALRPELRSYVERETIHV